jgi:hypothetical protein
MDDSETLEVVSVFDSAMDHEAMGGDVMRYAVTRDLSLVKTKPGHELTRFWLRWMTRDEMRWVKSAPGDDQRDERAFQFAVTKIENLVTRPPDSKLRKLLLPSGGIAVTSGRSQALSSDEMDQVPDCYIEDIGGVAFIRSHMGNAPGLSYPLPDSWRRGLVAIATSRRVDVADSDQTAADTTAGS